MFFMKTAFCLSLIIMVYLLSFVSINNLTVHAQFGHGNHELPAANLGDRSAVLNFENNPVQNGNGMDLKFSLIDQNNNQPIPHITSAVSIIYNNNSVFREMLHGHEGIISLRFIDKEIANYNINANYDNLAASYVSDYGAPIKVEGPVLLKPGNYTINAEIIGVDFDNIFLPEPLEYKFNIQR